MWNVNFDELLHTQDHLVSGLFSGSIYIIVSIASQHNRPSYSSYIEWQIQHVWWPKRKSFDDVTVSWGCKSM